MTELPEADLEVIQERSVAVLGYDALARAYALCLRDSGVDVRLGLPDPAGDPALPAADAAQLAECRTLGDTEGVRVVGAAEACAEADVVALLVPDAAAVAVYDAVVGRDLVEGDAVIVGSAGPVVSGALVVADDIDVALVTATAAGAVVRREFRAGRGTPALVAVVQDATGGAAELAVSFAAALGAARARIVPTTPAALAAVGAAASTRVAGGIPHLVASVAAELVAGGHDKAVVRLVLGAAFDEAVAAVRADLGTR